MSIHFSKFGLNTYQGTPYFRAYIPNDYPTSLVLQKSRSFRRLPPNLRELAEKSKEWFVRSGRELPVGIEEWYDDEGNELDPSDGHVLTDEEIDAQWPDDEALSKMKVKDIPVPDGGFHDPKSWEPEKAEEKSDDRAQKYYTEQIKKHGRQRVAHDAGISPEQLEGIESDEDLVKAIVGAREEE